MYWQWLWTFELAAGAGVNQKDPPLVWHTWQGEANGWVACELEVDTSGGFNQPREIVVRTPQMSEGEFNTRRGWWLRCQFTPRSDKQRLYERSPKLLSLRVEARGGTVDARHAVTIENEELGHSDGTPGQTFKLLNAPVLALDESRDYLVVTLPSNDAVEHVQRWQQVSDFGASGPADPHFTLDTCDGSITLGPTLIQPDRTTYQFGAVPPKNSRLHFSRYRYGGGVIGNVPRSSLSVLKSSVPYVTRVTNHKAAAGGLDQQSLDDARMRAPRELRTRDRAVTADDYAYLATKVNGVKRAHCLAPANSRVARRRLHPVTGSNQPTTACRPRAV